LDSLNILYRINISENEYFLIENRNNWVSYKTDIDSLRRKHKIDEYQVGHWFDTVTNDEENFIKDTLIVIDPETKVITRFDHYDYGLAKKGESLYRGGNASTGVAACIACHGPTGRGNPGAGYPSLAGQHAEYTEDALKDYTNTERKAGLNDMMQSLATRLTAEEIEAVSEYIQALGSK